VTGKSEDRNRPHTQQPDNKKYEFQAVGKLNDDPVPGAEAEPAEAVGQSVGRRVQLLVRDPLPGATGLPGGDQSRSERVPPRMSTQRGVD
jgi:hypothetical protein